MAIISRVPGVALLLVGLTLLSGNARAAEPSYDDYVAQVKAGKLDIDYTAFRMAYTASPKYEPYGAARLLVGPDEEGLRRRRLPGSDGAREGGA